MKDEDRTDGNRRLQRVVRGIRFSAAAIVCWGVLIGAAAALVIVRNNEAAAARAPLPAPEAELSVREKALWSHFPKFHNAIPILAYHGVDLQKNYLTVTRERFAEQLLALKTGGFHTVTLTQYARFERTGSTAGLPSNPILLTFDDGRLDSYQGANDTLVKFGDTAVMFVVADWPDSRPGWALHWSELVRMQQSGPWEIQEHAGNGHHHIIVSADGKRGEFYAYRKWEDGRLESYSSYKKRVTRDVLWGEERLKEHIPGYQPLAFAVPYSNYGQRFTNDRRIPRYFLAFLHTQFPIVVDGDYLDEGRGRPAEIKGRWDRRLSYRITQGPAMKLPDLYCRLKDFALKTPLWREYSCLKSSRSNVPSVHSD